jgi:hypothetical protein
MAAPQTVFIDTSVFKAAQFNFKGRQFRALLAAVPAGNKLKLLVPNPTEGEVQKHMAASATEAVHELKQLKKDHAVLHRALTLPSDATADANLERELKRKLQQAWSDFKAQFEIENLDCCPQRPSRILTD